MKKVLVTLPSKLDEGSKQQKIHFIYQTYIDKLVSMNILPVLVSSKFTKAMTRKLYYQADGVLLVGGSDIDPKLYGQLSHEKTKVVDSFRDSVEKDIIRLAIKQGKPILGICRGMQIVNCVLGGDLYQHLPDVINGEDHFISMNNPSYDAVASDRGQFLKVLPNTQLSQIVGLNKYQVRCAHHQAIDKIAPSLKINALSPAGVIEGLESKDQAKFIILLQNHIETQDSNFALAIWKKYSQVL